MSKILGLYMKPWNDYVKRVVIQTTSYLNFDGSYSAGGRQRHTRNLDRVVRDDWHRDVLIVYGNGDWVIPLSAFSKEGLFEEKVRFMKKQEHTIRAYLDKRIPEIRQDAYQPMQTLKKLLENIET